MRTARSAAVWWSALYAAQAMVARPFGSSVTSTPVAPCSAPASMTHGVEVVDRLDAQEGARVATHDRLDLLASLQDELFEVGRGVHGCP